MKLDARIEAAIGTAISLGQGGVAPPRLASALQYAVTPGGARIRPTILLSVALACGDDRPGLADAAAAALELIHCASLVHDDLPCFDDAPLRRGKPTVHLAYSEPLAVLTGDSLIILAFDLLAQRGGDHPQRALELIRILGRRAGMPFGICAGQGWESEAKVDLSAYHQAKTGALFIAATQMGAVAAGQEAEPWFELGARIGEAFQVADDLRDALYDEATLGKPAGQDAAHGPRSRCAGPPAALQHPSAHSATRWPWWPCCARRCGSSRAWWSCSRGRTRARRRTCTGTSSGPC